MSPVRRNRREAATRDGPPFGEKSADVALRPGQSVGPSTLGAYLVSCIDSFQRLKTFETSFRDVLNKAALHQLLVGEYTVT